MNDLAPWAQADQAADMPLPSVIHGAPSAVLLVDTGSGAVVYLNDRARQLAPDVVLPLDLDRWSQAARLHPGTDQAPGGTGEVTTLTRVIAGGPAVGEQTGALLHSRHQTFTSGDREAFWAIGVPLQGAPASLKDLSMLVLLPVKIPAGTPAPAPRQAQSVLAGSLAMAISDPITRSTDGPDNPLVWVSASFEHVTGYRAERALGRDCRFLQGPDTDPGAVARLRTGIAARRTVSEVLLNYRQDGSAFYNHLIVSPVFDAAGHLTHHVSVQSDVTQQVLTAAERDQAAAAGEVARTAQVTAEQARTAAEQAQAAAEQAQAAAQEAHRYAQLVLTLSEALAPAITVEDVARTVTDVVAAELGAAGGGLMLADGARTRLDFVSMHAMPPGIDASWSRIDWHEDAPPALAVRTRQAIFHHDSTALSASHPDIDDHAAVPLMGATVNMPLIAGDEVVGAVFLYWDQPQDLPAPQRAALEALARYTAQAVQRAALITERRSAAEVLQQSLLTRLPAPDHLELRARYVPAAAGEHVGGDWYDAVVMPDGATTLVIGDVTGHDMSAAAHMGQLRSMTRTLGYAYGEPPSPVLDRLEQVLAGLQVDTLATMVLARIEQSDDDAAAGLRRLRWSNAGHPPPVLLHPDGTTKVLETNNDLLIGLNTVHPRHDHTHPLPPGSTLVLFTDGLIEHRGRSLSEGLEDLCRVLSQCAGLTLEQLLDVLHRELIGEHPDDDCAVLAVRAHPEDAPRPTEAGPGTT